MDLTCPKCHAPMRQYERNGVTVDQCTDCRGLFLDRGELERLTAAENAWHREGERQPQQPTPQYQQAPQQYQQPQYQQPQYQQPYHHKKKKKSFFEELFD